jgi:hypothetical protein
MNVKLKKGGPLEPCINEDNYQPIDVNTQKLLWLKGAIGLQVSIVIKAILNLSCNYNDNLMK